MTRFAVALVSVVVCGSAPFVASAQEPAPTPPAAVATPAATPPGPEYRNAIFLNPLPALVGVVDVGYERSFAPHASVLFEGEYFIPRHEDEPTGRATLTSYGLIVQPHFYFKGRDRAPRGPYLGPFVEFAHAAVTEPGAGSASANSGEIGATLGWSWIWGRFNFKFGLGGGVGTIVTVGTDINGNAIAQTYTGGTLAVDLDTGIVF